MLLVRYLVGSMMLLSLHCQAEISFFTPPQKRSPPPAALLNKHFRDETPTPAPAIKPRVPVEQPQRTPEAGCQDLGKAAVGFYSLKFIGAPLPTNSLVQSLNNEFEFWKFKTPGEARDFIVELCNQTGLTTTAFR